MISAWTVACWPSLFQSTSMSKAASRRAQCGRQIGQDVAGEGELVEQGGVGGGRCRLVEGFELGFDLFAFVVEVGEAGADAGAHGGGGGVGRVGWELL